MLRSFLSIWPSLRSKISPMSTTAAFDVVMPQKVSPQISYESLSVPLPPYAKSGIPPQMANENMPEIKTSEAIAKMRTSCLLAKNILNSVEQIIRVGLTTEEIDQFVHQMTISNNAVSLLNKWRSE